MSYINHQNPPLGGNGVRVEESESGVRVEESESGVTRSYGESYETQVHLLESREPCVISVAMNEGDESLERIEPGDINEAFRHNAQRAYCFQFHALDNGTEVFVPEEIDVPLNWLVEDLGGQLIVRSRINHQIQYTIEQVMMIQEPYEEYEEEEYEEEEHEEEEYEEEEHEEQN